MKKRTLHKIITIAGLLFCILCFFGTLYSSYIKDESSRLSGIVIPAIIFFGLCNCLMIALKSGKPIDADWVLRKGQPFKVISVIELDEYSKKIADLAVEIDSDTDRVRFLYDSSAPCPNRGYTYRYIGGGKFENYPIGKSS